MDGYIDDIITAILDIKNWIYKGHYSAPLVVHTASRPQTDSDPPPRAKATSIRKMDGEGTLNEVKIVLGWRVDTRQFKIYLPSKKADKWKSVTK